MSDTDHAGTGRYTLAADADGGLVIKGGGGFRFAFRIHQGSGGSLELLGEQDRNRRWAFWSPAQAGQSGAAGGTILLAEGDLFQVLDRPGPVPGYDLVGWQGGGAYFSTEPEQGPEQIKIHPAGAALLDEDRGKPVLAMFVAVTTCPHKVRGTVSEETET